MSKEAWMSASLVVLVLVVFVVVWSKRQGGSKKSKAHVKGPLGMFAKAESSSEITPGVKIHDATSEEGGLTAEDQTGRGVDVKKIRTKLDISVTNVATPSAGSLADPKY